MDKNAIKKYAVWARNELIARVSQRAQRYGITKDQIVDANADSVNGIILTDTEKKQRQALIQKIREKGFEQVMEEVAYTWFNRFSALRFMEVNGYLPSHVRVFTDQNNAFKPEIMSEAIHLDLDGLDMEKVYALKEANNDDELFKYLIITQCNDLSRILPGMFQKIADYTELLFPDNLLREGSAIEQMIALIPEEDWKDQVQIIGWLYQYYNSEPKDQVFADLKKNKKITKEKIPAATQLFTPDWIVRYMVENSLGRLWVEGHPNDELKSQWKYYLDEAEQGPDVQKQLTEIRREYSAIKPEEIKCIDPCCGSGHILAYMFDVLIQIYGAYGISARDAAASIVKNNIYGLDIDERAAQLAQFSVMMKARQYDRRFFSRDVQPNVYAIEDSNGITSAPLHDMGIGLSSDDYSKAVKQIMQLIDEFHDAKEYGSIINVSEADWDLLRRFAVPRWMSEGGQISFEIHGEIDAAPRLQQLINLGQTLSQKYHVVVTNPPYMGNNNMNASLLKYAKDNYPDSKLDLFAMMIEKSQELTVVNGFFALITMHSWMFLGSFEKLREKLLRYSISSILHLGSHAFNNDVGTIVQNVAFVFCNNTITEKVCPFIRLVEFSSSAEKQKHFKDSQYRFDKLPYPFSKIPGSPIAYWVSDRVLKTFEIAKPLSEYGDSRSGLQTSDNNRFLRLWFEVNKSDIGLGYKNAETAKSSGKKWFPHTKGGTYRKWYGNLAFVVNWKDDGKEIKEFATDLYKTYSRIVKNTEYYFLPGITWSHTATKNHFGVRFVPEGIIFNVEAPTLFRCNIWEYIMGLLNSSVASTILPIMNQTMHFLAGDTAKFPVIVDENQIPLINEIVKSNIELEKADWDLQETSWDFRRNILIPDSKQSLSDTVFEKMQILQQRKQKIYENEVKLDQIYQSIYTFDDSDVVPRTMNDITVCDTTQEYLIKSLISYAVGCIMGRYSLDHVGLIYAGGQWDLNEYNRFIPDKDGIIPISDDEYFEDDIVGLFVKFISIVYGEETLESNLKYISTFLKGTGTPRQKIRQYFLNDFFDDHCNTYSFASSGKRPIYWLFDSGKKNGFKCLIYMHRYQPDTIARIRTDYIHEQQSRYRTAIADLEQRIESASTSDRVKLSKKLKHLQEQSAEIHDYEEKIHHLADQYISIDLDDGVKVNYAKFQDVLAKIK